MNIVTLHIEIEAMRMAVSRALLNQQETINAEMQAAIDAYCTSDAITAAIRQTATRAIDVALREEIEAFFRHGEGRKIVREAIADRLKGVEKGEG